MPVMYVKVGRLKTKKHPLEFYTTMRFLDGYLPKKGLVLKGGRGPGHYTVELTKRDNDVIALDPVKENLHLIIQVT